ncbi:MAG TPA: GNAT family N-acetyltransferase [Bacteroidia bacterium]|jgi:ribosomal protein S18 acetylase RimI-like enzyme
MGHKVTLVSCNDDQDSRKRIVEGLNGYNESVVPYIIPGQWMRLEFAAKNESGEVIGGILAMLGHWGGLEINVLWVSEGHRKNGLGSMLMKEVENIAREKGAVLAMVSTFDFHAPEFYLKNGYTVIGKHENFPGNHTRYYFEKRFR